MFNILVRGGGFSNKGAEAMLLTVKQELSKRLDSRFSAVVSPWETEACRAAGFAPVAANHANILDKMAFSARCLIREPGLFPLSLSSARTARQMMALGQCDAVVDISGYALGDSWGLQSAQRTLTVLKCCKENRKPFVFLPQAWGPFEMSEMVQTMREICQAATLAYARDEESLFWLRKVCNPGISVDLAPDIAFRFKADGAEAGERVLADFGFDARRTPLVGITPNRRLYKRTSGQGGKNIYVETMVSVIRHCLSRFGASVVLIPHMISAEKGPSGDDRYVCALLKSAFEAEARCVSLTRNYPPSALKALIGRLQLLVGSRYHSLVAALSGKVPCVAVSWSHKYPELMRTLGVGQYSYDFSSSEKDLLKVLEMAWESRENIKSVIAERLNPIERQVDGVFDLVARTIKENSALNG